MAASRSRLPFLAGLALLAALAGAASPALAGPYAGPYDVPLVEVGLTQQVVVDRMSGVALGGYDPVAYFTEGRPVPGSGAFETIWNGAAWRFANEGNMAAFLANPTVYAPCYGGYDASIMAGGIAAAGDPQIFLIRGDRLYLFRSEADRTEAEQAPDRLAAADAAWPAVRRSLIP